MIFKIKSILIFIIASQIKGVCGATLLGKRAPKLPAQGVGKPEEVRRDFSDGRGRAASWRCARRRDHISPGRRPEKHRGISEGEHEDSASVVRPSPVREGFRERRGGEYFPENEGNRAATG